MAAIPVPPLIPSDAQFADLQVNDLIDIPAVSLSKVQKWKDVVKAASVVDGPIATAYAAGQVLDGVTLLAGDRILLKDQVSGVENGLYDVNASGAPTRAIDMQIGTKAAGSVVFVTDGTVNADRGFICTNSPDADVVGTDVLTFDGFTSSSASLTANKLVFSDSTNQLATNDLWTVNTIGDENIAIGSSTVTAASARLQITRGAGTLPGDLSSTTPLVVQNNAVVGDSCFLSLVGGTSGFSGVQFSNQTVTEQGNIEYDHTNNQMTFNCDNEAVLSFTKDKFVVDAHLESAGPDPTGVAGTGGLAVVALGPNSTDTAGHIEVTGTGAATDTITLTYSGPYEGSVQCVFLSARNAAAATAILNGYHIQTTLNSFTITFVGVSGVNPEFDYFVIDPSPP